MVKETKPGNLTEGKRSDPQEGLLKHQNIAES